MQTTITRRAALTGTAAGAAAIVAGTAPATALDQDRAEWLALWQALLDQCPRHTAAINEAEVAEFAAKLTMARYYSSLNQCAELKTACDDALRLAGLPADMGEMRS